LNLWKPFRTFKICFLVSFLTDTYLSIKINFICLFFLVSLIHLKAVSENISSAIRGFFSVQCKDIGTNERIYPRHDLLWTTMAPRNPFSLNRTFISDRICPHSINITFCKNLFFNFVCRMSYFLLLFYLLKQERNPGMDLYAKNKMEKKKSSTDPGNYLHKLQVAFFHNFGYELLVWMKRWVGTRNINFPVKINLENPLIFWDSQLR